MLTEFLTSVRFLISRKIVNEVHDELRSPVEHLIETNLAAGMSPEQARRHAAIAFGAIVQLGSSANPPHMFEHLLSLSQVGGRM